MSAFGAIPLDVNEIRYEAMVSSANKCIEGVPGFGFVIARKSELEAAKGRSHSLSASTCTPNGRRMEKTGQWRFTPPTHVVAAFLEALRMHEAEGGVAGRGARYTPQPRRDGRRHARTRLRNAAVGSLAVADHRHLLLPGACELQVRPLLRADEGQGASSSIRAS